MKTDEWEKVGRESRLAVEEGLFNNEKIKLVCEHTETLLSCYSSSVFSPQNCL